MGGIPKSIGDFPGIQSLPSTAPRSLSAVRLRESSKLLCWSLAGEGQMGSALIWVTANFMLFDRGTFWVLPLTCFYLSTKVPGHTFFPNRSKIITFAAAPLGLTPFVRNQLGLPGNATGPTTRSASRRQLDGFRAGVMWSMPVSVEKTILLCEPLLCSPAAETLILPLIWCYESLLS